MGLIGSCCSEFHNTQNRLSALIILRCHTNVKAKPVHFINGYVVVGILSLPSAFQFLSIVFKVDAVL